MSAAVLLTANGSGVVAKIADVGLSRRLDTTQDLLLTTRPRGTPLYMAPEVMSNAGGLSAKIDVFAFGLTLNEVAVGSRPWTGIDSLILLFRAI